MRRIVIEVDDNAGQYLLPEATAVIESIHHRSCGLGFGHWVIKVLEVLDD